MSFLTKVYAKVMHQLEGLKRDERGSQTLEWLGIAAVVVIMVGVISSAFSDGSGIGTEVLNKIKGLIGDIGGGSGE
ncbi:hypothetical protein [Tenuibacillus multivorans]|uniref:Pilus assembly protein Flp/PilA n=1 Tax=Tenuibacillus multivorans TaxID=237069 RepID=A0A1G9WHF2_9BACI|nr:hypothetical protein [Tenuibacillus multivorans]GEL76467.1 hypothetical protein TMU01_07020 [Tenuibacillus multivorans]SDM83964.1 hypothetical protein SAMN05216498_0754 [Tenuibacillus multivorans]